MENSIPFQGKITREIFALTQGLNSGFAQHIGTIVPVALFLYGILLWAIRRELRFLLIPLAFAIVIFALRKVIRKIQINLSYGNTSYYKNVFAGELNQEGLLLKDEAGQLTIPWSKFVRFKSGPELMLLYKGPNLFHVIHKSHFDSDQAWADAERLVRSRISKGA